MRPIDLLQTPDQPVFFHDPGHGWLRVKRDTLIELGILDKVSGYSYQSDDRQFVFLEEDCDMTLYVDAIGRDNYIAMRNTIPSVYDDLEQVRNLPDFVPGLN